MLELRQQILINNSIRSSRCRRLGEFLIPTLSIKLEQISLQLRQVTYQGVIPKELLREPEEGLVQAVVGLGADIMVLEVLFAVEDHVIRLDLAVVKVDLVSTKDDWNIFADTGEFSCVCCQ